MSEMVRIEIGLPVSGHVHAPAPRWRGRWGHFYKSQEVIQTIIRNVKM